MRKIRNQAVLVSKILGSVPSIVYGLLYLAMIPLFAGIYSLMPDNFYHSTVQYEASITQDKAKIKDIIYRCCKESFINTHGPNWKSSEGYFLQLVSIDNLQINERNISFTIGALLYREYKHSAPLKREYEHCFSSADLRISLDRVIEDKVRIIFPIDFANERGCISKLDLKELFSFPVDGLKDLYTSAYTSKGSVIGFLVVPKRDMGHFYAYCKAMKGFPAYSGGNFGRMFYFSAVTITTLGYGDIVPITRISRTLVTVEAILGVVLVGLFLNSLAYQFIKPPGPS